MKLAVCIACVAASIATPVLSDPAVDVDGVYRCVERCRPGYEGFRTYIGQSGTQLNMVNEYGDTSTGYIDYPRRIWAEHWNQGAMVSPDGNKIQFDDGKIWLREGPVFGYYR